MHVYRSGRRLLFALVASGLLTVAGGAGAQSLPELAQRLAADHPRLKALRADVGAAQREAERVKAANGLHVSTFSDAGRHTANAPTTSAGDMGVRARYPVYDWGKAQEESSQSEAKLSVASAHLDAETYTLWMQLADAYINVLRQKAAGDIGQENVDRLKALRRQVQEIVQADPGRAIDLRQVDSRLAQAELQLMDRRTQEQDARVQLMGLLRLPAVSVLDVDDIGDRIPASLQGVLARLDGHPALIESDQAIGAARHGMRMQAALEKPRFDVQATASSRDNYGRFRPLGVGDVRIVVDWDAFDGGSAKAATAAAAERLRAAEDQLAAVRMDLQSDIARSCSRRRDIAPRLDLWRRQVASSTQLSEAFREQFRLGRRTILDLLTATADIHQAQLNASNDRHDLLQIDYRLYIQLGLAAAQWARNKN